MNKLKELYNLVEFVNKSEPLTKGYSDEQLKELFKSDKVEEKDIDHKTYLEIMNSEYS